MAQPFVSVEESTVDRQRILSGLRPSHVCTGKRAGLSANTLRYSERIGQRRYAAADMDWIGFLLCLRATPVPIAQMQAFARLRSAGNATAPEPRQMLEAQLAGVQAQVKQLRQSAQVLQTKIAFYLALEASAPPPVHPTEGKAHAPEPLRTRPCQTA